MQKRLFKISALLALGLILSSCEFENKSSNSSDTGRKQKKANTLACYLSGCFEPVRISTITDPNKDYAYPNPGEFNNPPMRPQYKQPFAILDLTAISPDAQLASNFTVDEFMSPAKGRYALLSSYLVTQMQLIRNQVERAVKVTSGYRSPGYNRNIDGAAKWSRHTYGDAVDFSIPGFKISDLTAFCEQFGASFTLVYEKHIHCDWREQTLDPAFYGRQVAKPKSQISAKMQMQNESEIVFKQNENQIQFRVESDWFEAEEDEGLPTHAWTILMPDGRSLNFDSSDVSLPKLSGVYKVDVVVGATIKLQSEFSIK